MLANMILAQILNGIQLGMLLFMLGAGLTLVFGIMNFVNLAHGSLYMSGAFIAASTWQMTGSFVASVLAAILGAGAIGFVLDRAIFGRLYKRSHVTQVLATFGIVLFANELARVIFGPQPQFLPIPTVLDGSVELFGVRYPSFRLFVIGVGAIVAGVLYVLMHRTTLGIRIRAGAQNSEMISALGVNIRLLNATILIAGAALAGLAGVLAGPILSVQVGMGEQALILALVVIVIGGIGSIKGAFLAALVVGVVDTLGRAFLPILLRQAMGVEFASAAGPALASMLIYLLMAAVLLARPAGLFVKGD